MNTIHNVCPSQEGMNRWRFGRNAKKNVCPSQEWMNPVMTTKHQNGLVCHSQEGMNREFYRTVIDMLRLPLVGGDESRETDKVIENIESAPRKRG